MELKDKLMLLRKEKGLSQAKLAEEVNVSRQAVSRWEVGSSVPSMENLTALSKLYGIPLTNLINENAMFEEDPKGDTEINVESQKSDNNSHCKKGYIIGLIVVVVVVIIGIYFAYHPRNSGCESDIKSIEQLDQGKLDGTIIEQGIVSPEK